MITLQGERFHGRKEYSWLPGRQALCLRRSGAVECATSPHPVRILVIRARTEAAISKKSKNRSRRSGGSSGKHGGANKTGGSGKHGAAQGRRRPGTVVALLVLTAVQAVGAIGGGIGLVRDPIDNIGMPLSMLEGSPFKDYLIPGIILLVVVGIFALFVWAGLLRRWKPAWWLSLASGGGLVVWIIVEAAMLGYLPGAGIGMQIAMGLLGVAIVVLTLLRPTRRYFGIGR
jgi:hypothetical protein